MKMWFKGQVFFLFVIVTGFTTIQALLNSHDEDYHGSEADRYDWTKHPCKRECNKHKPMKCHYVLVIENLSSMSKACYDCPFNVTDCYRPHCMPADGFPKTLYVANRQLPGPTIEVCQGDTIIVDVRNAMPSETVTIHWHGIKQKGSPYMDGVPYVSQCPILPNQKFTYVFNASTHGTYLWHSHMGQQRADGLFGALIIHPVNEGCVDKPLYDYDNQYILINEWNQMSGNDAMIREWHDVVGSAVPTTYLINGKGRYRQFRRNDTNTVAYVPSSVFKVRKHKRYRFRLINGGSEDCPTELSIDNHTMLIMSLDSRDIDPVPVDIITIWPGERVDFVLYANQSIDNYWIRIRGYGNCRTNSTTGVFQVAILRYKGAKHRDPKAPTGYTIPQHTQKTRIFNPFNRGTESNHSVYITIPLLNAMAENDISLKEKADKQVYVTFDFYPLNNYNFHRKDLYGYYQVPNRRRMGTLQMNHISFKFPSIPLLTQYDMIEPDTLCHYETISKNCTKEQCICTHVMKFELNSVVEIIFVDEGRYFTINHPFHLHGFSFRVIATESLQGPISIEDVKQLDREGKIKRRLDRAPYKDTIKAPGGGYTIIRFYANNPGYWYFHCHYDQHDNAGMALVVQVGEPKDFPAVPKNFPTCHNFSPDY